MKSKQNFASSIPDLLRLEDSPSCDAAMSLFKDLFRSIDSAVVTSFLTAYECMQDSLQTFEEIIETVSGDDGTTANRIKFSASTKQGDMIFGLLTISQCLHRSLDEAASESRQQLKAATKELESLRRSLDELASAVTYPNLKDAAPQRREGIGASLLHHELRC